MRGAEFSLLGKYIFLSCKTDMSAFVARIGLILLFQFDVETTDYDRRKCFHRTLRLVGFLIILILAVWTILPDVVLAIRRGDRAA